jgi:hypothetical protein
MVYNFEDRFIRSGFFETTIMKKIALFSLGFFLLLSGCTTEYVTPVRAHRAYSDNNRHKHHSHKRHKRYDSDHDRYYYDDDDDRYERRGRFCPPGQAKKGNC